MSRRRWVVALVAVGLALFAFVFRFNALGGAFGGFDNDHFIYLVRASAVARGERPLRDFADAGLQGAWPSLSYLVPALAQQWIGATFWAEALTACVLVAAAIAIMFVTGSSVASVFASMVTAVLTLLVGTKLYNYPRLFVFAVGTALLAWYARTRSWAAAASLGAWSVVAFLVRHDFGVYMAVAGAAVIIAGRAGERRGRTIGQLLTATVVGVVLVTPPLLSVTRYEPLGQYVSTNLEMGRRERERTTLRWPRFSVAGQSIATFFWTEENAVAWLYYFAWALPIVALVLFWPMLAGPREASAIGALGVTLALLVLMLDYFFLRGNVAARFGDIGAPLAVLAAMMMSRRPGERAVRTAVRIVVAAVLVAVTTESVFTVGSVSHELDTAGLSDSAGKIGRQFVSARTQLQELPGGGPDTPFPAASRYLVACTAPTDRVLLAMRTPEILAMAGRAFAGGQPTFIPGFYSTPEDQRLTVERLSTQRVPVMLAPGEADYAVEFAKAFPLVTDYVEHHFVPAGDVPGADPEVRVFVNRDIPSSRPDPATGLPCFR